MGVVIRRRFFALHYSKEPPEKIDIYSAIHDGNWAAHAGDVETDV